MTQLHFLHRARRYYLNDIPALPLLAYEDFESIGLGQTDLPDGWANAGLIYTYAGEIGYEDFETSTLTNNSPPDHGWIGPGNLIFTVTITGSPAFVDPGGTITYTANTTVAAGSTLTYQWFKDGIAMTNTGAYSGVTTASLTITGTVAGDYTSAFSCAVTCLGVTITATKPAGGDRASDWANRVVANGGPAPSSATVTAARTFWNGLLSDGLTGSDFLALNFFAPDSLTAALTPFIKGAGLDPWTNNSFVGADLTVNGLLGDGASKYLDTGLVITANLNNFGCALYAYTHTAASTDSDYGTVQVGTAHIIFDSAYTISRNGYEGTNDLAVAAQAPGFFLASRVSSTDHRIFFANSGTPWVQRGFDGATNTRPTMSAMSLFVFAYHNYTGGAVGLSRMRCSFCAPVVSMNSTKGSNLYNRVQTLRTSLGGGYV